MLSPPPPPRFQNQKLTNIGSKSLLSMKYSFSGVTFMRFFARDLCIHSYMEIKELIPNPRLPILFRPPPPQVVTCSSASERGCPLSEAIIYRLFIQEYSRLVLCWEVCPLLECPLSEVSLNCHPYITGLSSFEL